MPDVAARHRRLFLVARARVSAGFFVGAGALWLAQPSWPSLGAGALVAAAGEALRVWAAGHLRKGEEITSSGPYRYLRHPLYCGSAVIGVGFAVAAADLPAAGLVLGYLGISLASAVRLEEATLREAFGAEFERYVAGSAAASARRFSLARMVANGEHQALAGFAAILGVLALKAWLRAACIADAV